MDTLFCITIIKICGDEESSMKKWIREMVVIAVVVLLGSMPVSAAELEQVQKSMVLETVGEVELLDKPVATAQVVCTLSAGTAVVVLEDEDNDWCKVTYQEQEGYLEVSMLKTLGNQKELNAEFDKISNTIQLFFEEIITRENQQKQARIWGTIIVVLIVAIFGVGIASAVKKNKLEQ